MADAKRTEGEPHDRLTRMCDAMQAALKEHPEYTPNVKGVILLDDYEEGRGGLNIFDYDDDADAIAAMFMHLKAIFEANGKQLTITSIGGEG